MMTKNIALKIGIVLLACQSLTACKQEAADSDAPQQLLAPTPPIAGLASGVDFKNRNNLEDNGFVVTDPATGQTMQSCGATEIINNETFQDGKTAAAKESCNNKILNPSPELAAALSITKPIKGFVIKDGHKTPAAFYVSVEAVYLGSYCVTYYLNGRAYTKCFN